MSDNKSLNRGLDALLGDQKLTTTTKEIDLEKITAGRYQPRQEFDDVKIQELADSIKKHGVLSPILVREVGLDKFEVIAGERRWRAAQIAQLDNIPAIIKTLSDDDALEIAIIENVQRSNLSPVDEADGYQRLIDIYNYTQEDLAQVIGKSRSYIANILRLNNLPTKVKDYLSEGLLTIGHARALISLENAENLADMIVSKGLSVRQIEQLVKNSLGAQKKSNSSLSES